MLFKYETQSTIREQYPQCILTRGSVLNLVPALYHFYSLINFVPLSFLDCCGSALLCHRFRLHSPHERGATDCKAGKRLATLLQLNYKAITFHVNCVTTMTLLPTASIPAEGKTKPVLSSEKCFPSIGAFVYDMTLVIAKDIYCCFTSLLIVCIFSSDWVDCVYVQSRLNMEKIVDQELF